MDTAQYWFQAASDYQIERSLRFNSADSAYLNRTPASAGNRKTWTFSCWFKLGNHSSSGAYGLFGTRGTNDGTYFVIQIRGQILRINTYEAAYFALWSTQVFRDPSAWYHLVVALDTTQATASNRAKAYVNGTQITQWSTANYGTQSVDLGINQAGEHLVGAEAVFSSAAANFWDGYMSEVHLIDGQALTASSFGEINPVTGVWQPKRYTGTYGTNGFYLNFADNSGTTSTTLGKDSSGNGNNWTPNNFSVTAGSGNDSLIDTPTPYADGGNGRGNYCTWLPQQGAQAWTFSNGNLDAVNGNFGSAAYSCIGTIAVSTGKWYWEVTCNDAGPTTLRIPGVGIMGSDRDVLNASVSVRPDVYLSGNGTIDNSAGTALQSGFSNMAAGDIVGVALDAGAKTVQFYRNGSAVGTAQSYTAAFVTPSFYSYFGYDCNANFGQRPFAYTPPAGFLALNTQNLPEPTIKKPSSYMDVRLYTGNSATQSITGLEFSPDLVWIKGRSVPYNNALFDAIRGARNVLISNSIASEGAEPVNTSLTSFDTSGFTLGGGTPTYAAINAGSTSYVAWCWDESATPGFDIVTYTGNGTARTIAHSLGVAPSMVIVKDRSAATDWSVWSKPVADSLGASYGLFLQSTANAGSYPGIFNSTAPTSSVFSVGTSLSTNTNGNNYVAYLWSEVAGFSKFGSYSGSGSADGPFIYCGFRPRWIMIKRTDSAANWQIYDTARDTINSMYLELVPNSSAEENSVSLNIAVAIDALSNGFKLRSIDTAGNASGGTYIFAAFAESPFKYSLAR